MASNVSYARIAARAGYALQAWFNGLGKGAWVVLFIVGVSALHFHNAGDKLGGDADYYFLYARNLAMHGDLKLAPGDRDVAEHPVLKHAFSEGVLRTPFSIGPAIVWLPFYAAAYHGASLFASGPLSGFEHFLRELVGLVTIGFVGAGLLLLLDLLRSRGDGSVLAVMAVLGVYLGTFLVNYTVFEPAMAHGLGFFWVVLALWLMERARGGSAAWVALVGMAIGMAGSTRYTSLLCGILPLLSPGIIRGRNDAPLRLALLGAGCFLGFLPQMAAWWAGFGAFAVVPQGGGFMRWSSPQWVEVLFSPLHGLFSSHLLLGLGIVSYFVLHERPSEKLAFMLVLLGLVVANGAADDFFGGWAFGPRRFEAVLPFCALGLSAGLRALDARWLAKSELRLGLIIAAAVLWNLAGLDLFRKDQQGRGYPLRGTMVYENLQGYMGSAFSLPAGLAFGARHGIRPGAAQQVIADYVDGAELPYVDIDPVSEPWRLLGGFGGVWRSPDGRRYRFLDRGTPSLGFAYRWPKDVEIAFKLHLLDPALDVPFVVLLNDRVIGNGSAGGGAVFRASVPAGDLDRRLNVLKIQGKFDGDFKYKVAISSVRFSEPGRIAPAP